MSNNYSVRSTSKTGSGTPYGSKRGGAQYTITVSPLIEKIVALHQREAVLNRRGMLNRSNAVQELMMAGAKALGFDFEAAEAELEAESKSASASSSGPEV